jgi:UDP-2-acetamido-3-amino-2,3-dideoxy-glucuronate N-acetyltransferase
VEQGKPRIALVGFGRWGANHARTLHAMGLLSAICDTGPGQRRAASEAYPGIPVTEDVEGLDRLSPDGVVLATSAHTHAPLARHFLERGTHVLVEKPLALRYADGAELVALAERKGLTLMVGHVLEYHPVRDEIEKVLEAGGLGDLLSVRMVRANLGTVRDVEDVLFSFAPHDISFALRLAAGTPERVTAVGFDLFDRGIADTAHLVLEFPPGGRSSTGLSVAICASWMEPIKEHRSVLVGTRGMLEWSDTAGGKSLTLWTSGVARDDRGCPRVVPGQRQTMALPEGEPLRREIEDFARCIATRSPARVDGRQGLDVLAVLEAAELSASAHRSVSMNEVKKAGQGRVTSLPGVTIHESAYVDEGAEIGEGSRVWHFCHVMSGARIGRNVVLSQNCYIASRAVIGDGCRIQNNVSLYDGVELGQDVFVGPSAVFTNVRHPRAFVSRKNEYRKTLVKKGATIGANSTIVCGVTIGEHAFVAAGAVVVSDVPPHAMVAGVPEEPLGWACTCGERLKKEAGKPVTCGRCGETLG